MKHDPALGMDDAQPAAGGSILSHIPAIIWQRKWWLIVPVILCSIAGVAAAFLLPISYRSSATLLVQSAAVSSNATGEDNDDLIDRRIARIREQVLSRPGLIELINKYQLYPKQRAKDALSDIIEKMRGSITLAALNSDVKMANGSSTIAFTLAYNYGEAVKAQAVTQDLVEQVLLLDATGNSEQAKSQVQFLVDQQRGVQDQINQLETEIASIKRANGAVLTNNGMAALSGGGMGYDVQIAGLQRENAALLSQRDLAKQSDTRDPMVAGAEASLAALQATYSDDYPDVKLAKQRLAEAKALAQRNVAKLPLQQVDQQIQFNNQQIATLRAAQAGERARVAASLGAQSRAPLVLDQIAQLQQKLDGLYGQFRGISDRLLQARAGQKADNEQLGERLTVVDPPVVPDEPTFPNRLMFSGGGVAAGFALGLLLIGAVEIFRRPIRDPASLTEFFGETPLGVVPTIKPKKSAKAARPGFFARFRRKRAASEPDADPDSPPDGPPVYQ